MAWAIGNYALSQEQMNANALEVYKYLSAREWSLNAIAGLLGNMQSESYVNPGVWQSLQANNYSGGSCAVDSCHELYGLGAPERI